VTISAGEPLSGVVIGMTKRASVRARIRARWSIRFLIVTNSTRRDFATRIRFARGRVARVAIVVGGDVCRNRQSRASIDRRIVTTRAASLRARRSGHVLSMIKLDIERFVEARRKILQRWIVTADIGVADNTHRHLRRRELPAMTVSAGFVTGKAWRC